MLAQHFCGSSSNISWAKRTYVFTGRSSHPASPGGGRRRAPLRERKKRRRTLYVTGIPSRGQEMALIFDGFLPVTKRKRARAHVSRRPLCVPSSHAGAFVLGGASRRTRDATTECEVSPFVSLPETGSGESGRASRSHSRSAMFNPALNAMFERAIPGA